MARRQLWCTLGLIVLSFTMLAAFQVGARASPLPRVHPSAPDGGSSGTTFTRSRDHQADKTAPLPIDPTLNTAGKIMEIFTNTWSYNSLGLVYDPVRNQMRYVHESQSNQSSPTVFDVDRMAHTVVVSFALSAQNLGWPWQLDNRTGAGYDYDTDTYFLTDYNGDQANADDNIVEVSPNGTILNAWEMDDEVGSNDSLDGSEIDSILDIAVVPGTPPRYFATAAYDGSVLYEIELIKTGTWWTPNSWSTVMTCTLPGLVDNLGVDYDAGTHRLYHSGWHTDTIVVTDLGCNVEETFTCKSNAGYNSGVTYIEGSHPPEVWVTNFSNDQTTRCEAPGAGTTSIVWDKRIDGISWSSGLVHTGETSDTIEIVDVFTATQPLDLIETWDPAQLQLVSWTTAPQVGQVITQGPSYLRWEMPPYPQVMTITKWFHIRPSTWETTTLSEMLFANHSLHDEKPVIVEKRPPVLTLSSEHPTDVVAGSIATYTLHYTNTGGYENDVAVRSSYPITLAFVHAHPFPDLVGPNGSFAVWELGDLANGSTGQIDVAVEILPTAVPSHYLGVQSRILDHMGNIAGNAHFEYHVTTPPTFNWEWFKFVEGEPWHPGMVVTTETSQTIQVVDEVFVDQHAVLIEHWNSDHLQLFGIEYDGGSVPTLPSPGDLEWVLPPGHAVLTKTFHVEPCTWIGTELWEELIWMGGGTPQPVAARPVFIEKRPSDLWIDHEVEPDVQPGQEATFILRYGNAGGFESGASIRNTFPVEALFIGAVADPPALAKGADPNGRWAWWDFGPLASGDEGLITVTVEITPGLPPSTTIPIQDYIVDHADIERDWTEIRYHIEPPTWEKRVNDVTWYDGISVTTETGDSFTVVDVITGSFNTALVEIWNPQRLTLLETQPSCGNVITHTGALEWLAPEGGCPEVVELFKRFRVEDCAWTHSLLHEELWVEGIEWEHRPVVIFKRPAELWLTADFPPEAFAGDRMTYTLDYGNVGADESGAWITSTFPVSAPLVAAFPAPDGRDPNGRWAQWNIGLLPRDARGTLTVSVEISPAMPPYHVVHTHNYIYDHVDIERVWTPISITVQPPDPIWEKAVWIGGQGPYGPGDSPFNVLPGDTVTVIDRVHVTAGAPVSYTLVEAWSDALAFSTWSASGGSVLTTPETLVWQGWGLAEGTWHVLTKTFDVLDVPWDTGALTETLTVAYADPATTSHALAFDRGLAIYLPLVMRTYQP